MVKILIIGGSGVVGSKLVEYFNYLKKNVEFTYNTNKTKFPNGHYLDITQKKHTIELIEKINPDIIIHTAALTNVDLCETNNKLAHMINVKGTENILEGCKNVGGKIVFVSTSFVFDGQKMEYFEDDQTSPSTFYGVTKFNAEQLVIKSKLPFLILRIDQPYCWNESWQHTNSVLRVLESLQSKKILNEISDWYNTPTYVPDFVDATEKLIEKNFSGIFHIVGPDFINRYKWALIVAEIFNLDKNLIHPITSKTLNLHTVRSNVNLKNVKLKNLGIDMKNIRAGALDMLKSKIKQNIYNDA
jgi:dTDP-4-dehydrorhamnose reductase